MKSLSLIIWPLELFHQPMSPFNESKFFFHREEGAEGRASDPAGVLFLGGERDEIRPDIVCREKVSWLNSSL